MRFLFILNSIQVNRTQLFKAWGNIFFVKHYYHYLSIYLYLFYSFLIVLLFPATKQERPPILFQFPPSWNFRFSPVENILCVFPIILFIQHFPPLRQILSKIHSYSLCPSHTSYDSMLCFIQKLFCFVQYSAEVWFWDLIHCWAHTHSI